MSTCSRYVAVAYMTSYSVNVDSEADLTYVALKRKVYLLYRLVNYPVTHSTYTRRQTNIARPKPKLPNALKVKFKIQFKFNK